MVSNHEYGYLNSPEIAVQPGTTYRVSAWITCTALRMQCRWRGEIGTEEVAGNWILRAYYYDANHTALSYASVALGATAPANWTQQGGDFTTPSNAAYVRIRLDNYMNSGWHPRGNAQGRHALTCRGTTVPGIGC